MWQAQRHGGVIAAAQRVAPAPRSCLGAADLRSSPYACSRGRGRVAKQSVAETHPHLVGETDFDLTAVTSGSSKKVTWRCPAGHEWQAVIRSRCAGSGCPYCSNRRVLPGFNDLATTHPEIAAQCLDDPTTLTPGSDRKVRWRCASGHEWLAVVYQRTSQNSGCPKCSRRTPTLRTNDLATTHPELAAQALFDATAVSAGSARRLRWRCAQGHEWYATPGARTNLGSGCPACAGQRVIPGVNDLATRFPGIAREALFDPTKVMSGSSRKMPWRCAEGHEWEAVVHTRTSRGLGCPMCAGQRAIVGVNDLATRFPDIAREALFDPTEVMWGSNRKLSWRCPRGHEYEARVADRTGDGAQCPYCQGKRVLPGFNDLATVAPHIAEQATFDPTTVTGGSGKIGIWRCSRGHEWKAQVSSRVSNDLGCPYCSGQRVLAGFNDLATINPRLAREALFDATKMTARSNFKGDWQCSSGHRWTATVSSRSGGSGCPSCAVTGYDPNKPGHLYLLEHLDWALTQIGISNVIAQRIADHEKRGWAALDVRGPMDGVLAKQWESSIIAYLRRRGVAAPRGRKFSGRTESWVTSEHPVRSLYELMRVVEDAEDRGV